MLPLTGMDYSPSLSVDGKWVVFTSERKGSADIYRVHPDGTGLEPLTQDPAFDDQATLSPDGKTLAFVSTRKSGYAQIWLMDVASRKARLVNSKPGTGFHPAWSPDGKWLTFSSDQRRFAGHLPGRWEKIQSLSVFVVRPDGSGLRRITRGRGVAGSPRWSPDGKRIFYYETTEVGAVYSSGGQVPMGTNQIVSVDVHDGSFLQHTSGDGVRKWPHPLIDGSVAYLATDPDGVQSLNRINGETTTKGISGELRSPSWSADGSTVVYARIFASKGIEILPGFSAQKDFKLTVLGGGGFYPSPSPNGGPMLISDIQSFITLGRGNVLEKTLYSSAGSRSLVLSPAWSPDGKKIAFSQGSYFRPSNHPSGQIGLMNSDGSDVKLFGQVGTNCGSPSWSPDGKAIVYSQDGHLVIWSLADGRIKNLTPPGGNRDNFPEWSPNGDWISFTSDRDGDEDFRIYLIRPDGTGLHRITHESGDSHAIWSPDGKWLIFTSARMGFKDEHALSESPQPYGELFIVRPDGSGLRQITDDKWEAGTPAWIRAAP